MTDLADHVLVIRGAHSSPYSRKMRAVLRYRHIAHEWVVRGSAFDEMPQASVPVIPVLGWRDDAGEYHGVMHDSSPQITKLEELYDGRSVVPTDPATAFLDFVLEDFADEWVSKAMYHYRWVNEPDTVKSGKLLVLDSSLQLDDQRAERAAQFVMDRQISRRAMIGSTKANAPIIEGSYERLLDALQVHLGERNFFFGERPGRADFAMFGQLMPLLWWDPTPMAIAVERAPRAIMWNQWMDDLAWWRVDGDQGWTSVEDVAETTRSVLAEAGRTYAPFMVANAGAVAGGADELACEMEGGEYRQAPFKYQAKCLAWIHDEYRALSDTDRRRVDAALDGTGCEVLVTGA